MENTVSKVKKILLRKTNLMPDNLAVPFAGARAIFECQNKELGNALVSRAKKEAKTASGEYRSASPAVIVPIIIFHSALSLKFPLPYAPVEDAAAALHLEFNTPLFFAAANAALKTLETRAWDKK
jgi:hypothetical protein